MENTNAIELKHITKRFGSITANDDINLAIGHGEIIALLWLEDGLSYTLLPGGTATDGIVRFHYGN